MASGGEREDGEEAESVRRVVEDRADPLSPDVRTELFGADDLGPSVVLDMIGSPSTFRGLASANGEGDLKAKLEEAVQLVSTDRGAALAKVDLLIARGRGTPESVADGVNHTRSCAS
jgi:hypothetical protein